MQEDVRIPPSHFFLLCLREVRGSVAKKQFDVVSKKATNSTTMKPIKYRKKFDKLIFHYILALNVHPGNEELTLID